ncbi:MAG: transposase [Planctomycetota bacterium]
MSRHYTLRPPRFAIQFKPSEKATVHGGQLAVAAVMERFGLKRRVKRCAALDPRKDTHKGYDPEVYVTGIVYALTSGGCTLSEVEKLSEDEALKACLGVKRFPDESSVGEWMRNVGETGVEAIRRIGRDFVEWALAQAEGPRYRHAGQVECFFDDTQIEVHGRTFEGATVNYEGNLALGWQTLWVGPFLVDGVLGGAGDVSSQLDDLLSANGHLWKPSEGYLYADSGSSAGSYLKAIGKRFDQWSVSYNKWTEPLERLSEGFPEGYWSPVVERRGRKGETLREQYAWLRHQPEGMETPVQYAVARYRSDEDLFWRYSFIATSSAQGTPQGVFERHRLKGDFERRFSELLSDLDLHHPPCANLAANRVYYALATLAYNILQALKLIWMSADEQSHRVRTLVHRLLLIPVEIKRHARQVLACFYLPEHAESWWRQFIALLLPRCHLMPSG